LVEELRRMGIVGSNAAVRFYKRDGGQEVPINSTAVQDLLTLQATGAQILFESSECESEEESDVFESLDELIEKLEERISALKLKEMIKVGLTLFVIISLIIILATMIYMIITSNIFREIMFVIGTIISIWYMMNMIRKSRNY
jgi:Flp pilus assembly protein TadB